MIQFYEKQNLVKRVDASNDADKVSLVHFFIELQILFLILDISRCSKGDEELCINSSIVKLVYSMKF